MPRMSTNQSGFTLVEIAVVAPIVIIAITAILALLINLMGNNLAARAEVAIIHDTNAALTTIEDDVRLSTDFMETIGTDFTDPYGPDGSGGTWDFWGGGAGDRALILRTYATTRSPRDSQKQPVYVNENGCSIDIILSNPALLTNIIYFVRDGDLYRRTLTRTGLATCGTQFQRHSCPPDLPAPNAICQTEDALLLSNISDFDVEYYASAAATTQLPVYGAADPEALNAAKTVKIIIHIERRLSGHPFELTRELRVNKLNK